MYGAEQKHENAGPVWWLLWTAETKLSRTDVKKPCSVIFHGHSHISTISSHAHSFSVEAPRFRFYWNVSRQVHVWTKKIMEFDKERMIRSWFDTKMIVQCGQFRGETTRRRFQIYPE